MPPLAPRDLASAIARQAAALRDLHRLQAPIAALEHSLRARPHDRLHARAELNRLRVLRAEALRDYRTIDRRLEASGLFQEW